jgi:chloramphenicol O-acetyltransferase
VFEDSTQGASLISYNLQVRDSIDNVYKDLTGSDKSLNLATRWTVVLIQETIYEFRYRVKNSVGWSEFSPAVTITAADLPSQPSPPTLVSASDTEITLLFSLQTVNNGGLPL